MREREGRVAACRRRRRRLESAAAAAVVSLPCVAKVRCPPSPAPPPGGPRGVGGDRDVGSASSSNAGGGIGSNRVLQALLHLLVAVAVVPASVSGVRRRRHRARRRRGGGAPHEDARVLGAPQRHQLLVRLPQQRVAGQRRGRGGGGGPGAGAAGGAGAPGQQEVSGSDAFRVRVAAARRRGSSSCRCRRCCRSARGGRLPPERRPGASSPAAQQRLLGLGGSGTAAETREREEVAAPRLPQRLEPRVLEGGAGAVRGVGAEVDVGEEAVVGLL